MRQDKSLFKVIIAGTRSFTNYALLRDVCDNLLADKKDTSDIVILSGGAKGADALGEQYAEERKYEVRRYPADWGRFARSAGPVRNSLMAHDADALIAFWDGISKGTKDMIDKANSKGLIVRIIIIK